MGYTPTCCQILKHLILINKFSVVLILRDLVMDHKDIPREVGTWASISKEEQLGGERLNVSHEFSDEDGIGPIQWSQCRKHQVEEYIMLFTFHASI